MITLRNHSDEDWITFLDCAKMSEICFKLIYNSCTGHKWNSFECARVLKPLLDSVHHFCCIVFSLCWLTTNCNLTEQVGKTLVKSTNHPNVERKKKLPKFEHERNEGILRWTSNQWDIFYERKNCRLISFTPISCYKSQEPSIFLLLQPNAITTLSHLSFI